MLKIAVSACLLGAPVRYDARDKKADHPILERWIAEGRVVSICPEMLGGLGAPRPPAEIRRVDGMRRVFTNEGRDVTAAFEEGAHASAAIAASNMVRIAILKSDSPSCGSSTIYDGSFSKTRVPGEGVTTSMLRSRGIVVFSELELEAADDYVRREERR